MSEKLTGRTRHRIKSRMFSPPLLILQVEVDRTTVYTDPHFFDAHKTRIVEWRDAVVEDLTVLDPTQTVTL